MDNALDRNLWRAALARRELSGISAIGVNEIAYAKCRHYATLVYQINSAGSRQLLYMGEGRTVKTRLLFFLCSSKRRSTSSNPSLPSDRTCAGPT